MLAVIVEDERLSAERLLGQISKIHASIEVIATLDSLKAAKEWFRDNSPPELVFLDIQLGDGTAFELIDDISLEVPIIFTTAYDEFAIKAFQFNCVDYLLKPIRSEKLESAVQKLIATEHSAYMQENRTRLDKIKRIVTGDFKKRFLVKVGERFIPVNTADIAYFVHQKGSSWIYMKEGQKYILDQSLDQIESLVSPLDFYRINRQMIITLTAISEIHTYFNSRLLVKLSPQWEESVIVSRDRVGEFKRWMDI